jgi:hypothetical protein
MAEPWLEFQAPESEGPWSEFAKSPVPPVEAQTEGGLVASAKQAIGQGIKGAGQVAADYIPGVSPKNALSSYGQSVVDANPTAVHGFDDIADKPWTAVKEAVGNAAGSMGTMVGARALGMGMTAAAPFTGPAAPFVAGAGQLIANAGPIVAAALPSYSGIREGQIQANPNNEADAKSKAIALLGAGTVGAIETKFGPQEWALAAMQKGGIEALGKKFAGQSLVKAAGIGALKGGAIEGGEELVQNPIEQMAAYQDPTTKANVSETLFGGAMGAIGGGVLGGTMGAVAPRVAAPAPEAPPAIPGPSTGGTFTPDPNGGALERGLSAMANAQAEVDALAPRAIDTIDRGLELLAPPPAQNNIPDSELQIVGQEPANPVEPQRIVSGNEADNPTGRAYGDALAKQQRGELLTAADVTALKYPPPDVEILKKPSRIKNNQSIDPVNQIDGMALPAAEKLQGPEQPADDVGPNKISDTVVESPQDAEKKRIVEVVSRLQNRNRSSAASAAQMAKIASNPDPDLLMASPTMSDGAPVASDLSGSGVVPETQQGRTANVSTAKRKIPVRYAVVEASSISASNFADGSRDETYATDPGKLVAINNGRTAGVLEAYRRGTAGQYRATIEEGQDTHGIPKEIIAGMKAPVLVRLIASADVTENIGDESNAGMTLGLSATEQAKNDASRLDMSGIEYDEDGHPLPQSVRMFIAAMPESEQQTLAPNGEPTKQAIDRLAAATFHAAYDNSELVGLMAEATDPDAVNILRAMSKAAASMAKLKDAGDLDIRSIIVGAAMKVVNAARSGVSMKKFLAQGDMFDTSFEKRVADMFATNARSPKKIAEDLVNAADFAYAESIRDVNDMFGDSVPRASREEVLKREERDTTSEEDLGQQGRRRPGNGNDGNVQNDAGNAGDARQNQVNQPGQDYDTGDLLASYSKQDLEEKEARIKAAEKETAKLEAELERKAKIDALLNRKTGVAKNPKAVQNDIFNGNMSLFSRASKYGTEIRTLDLFTSQIPTRPGEDTADSRSDRLGLASTTLLRGAKGSLLGLAISSDWIRGKGSELIGKRVTSAADLATLGAVLRDPRTETFRYFLMKGDTVVYHTAVSSRLESSSAAFVGRPETFLLGLSDTMERLSADGYYLMHNHPSRRVKASDEDWMVTDFIAEKLPGFRGHVILDHTEFGLISPRLNAIGDIVGAKIDGARPLKAKGADQTRATKLPHAALDSVVSSPKMLAALAHEIRSPSNVILVSADAQHHVTGIMEISADDMKKGTLTAVKNIMRLRKATGSNTMFAVLPKGMELSELSKAITSKGLLLDASAIGIRYGENGAQEVSESAAEKGMLTGRRPLGRDRTGIVDSPRQSYGTGDLFANMQTAEREEIAAAQRKNSPQMDVFAAMDRAQKSMLPAAEKSQSEPETQELRTGYRSGGNTKGMAPLFGNTEGNGVYIAHEKETAQFFSGGRRVDTIKYRAPKKPLIVNEEPLPLLNEDFPLYDAIKKSDSEWIRLNKIAAAQAKTLHGVSKDKYDGTVIGNELTKLMRGRGYDAVDVTSGGEKWIVLLDDSLLDVSKKKVNRSTPRASEQLFTEDASVSPGQPTQAPAPDGATSKTQGMTNGTTTTETQQAEAKRPEEQPAAPVARPAALPNHPAVKILAKALPEAKDVQIHSTDSLSSEKESGTTGRMSKWRGKTIERMAKVFGRKRVVFFSSANTTADGMNIGGGDTLYVNIDSGIDPIAVVGHEWRHALKTSNAAAHAAINQAATKLLDQPGRLLEFAKVYHGAELAQEDGGSQETKDRMARIEAGEATARDKAFLAEEFSADMTGNLWRDPKALREVFDTILEQHPPSAARTIIKSIVDAMHKLINKLIISTPKGQYGEMGISREELLGLKKEIQSAMADSFKQDVQQRMGNVRGVNRSAPREDYRRLAGTKVVDENGAPMLVYHSGKEKIEQFDAAKTVDGGFHFGTYEQAKMRGGKRGEMLVARLAISNPRRSKDMGGNWKAKIVSAKATGHDGIVYLNRYEGVTAERIKALSESGQLNKLDQMSDAEFRQVVPEARDSYIAFRPEQIIAAAGNSGAFSEENPDIRFSPPRFFSQLSTSIDQIPKKMETMPAAQWRMWLTGNAAKLGIKKDEVTWSGIDDYLALRGKDKVTKAEVQQFLSENWTQINDVVLGAADPAIDSRYGVAFEAEKTAMKKLHSLTGDLNGLDTANLPWWAFDEATGDTYATAKIDRLALSAEARQAVREYGIARNELVDATAAREANRGAETKFGEYVVPGGTNYRELLITLPDKTEEMKFPEPLVELPKEYVVIEDSSQPEDRRFGVIRDDQANARPAFGRWPTETAAVEDALRMLNYKQNTEYSDGWRARNETGKFKSSHFDQPNILAHLRMDERMDAQGDKVLFLEELQSDFGQSFKKQKDAINKAVDDDFLGIVERMKKDGVLEVECD